MILYQICQLPTANGQLFRCGGTTQLVLIWSERGLGMGFGTKARTHGATGPTGLLHTADVQTGSPVLSVNLPQRNNEELRAIIGGPGARGDPGGACFDACGEMRTVFRVGDSILYDVSSRPLS